MSRSWEGENLQYIAAYCIQKNKLEKTLELGGAIARHNSVLDHMNPPVPSFGGRKF